MGTNRKAAFAVALSVLVAALPIVARAADAKSSEIDRGRYLIRIAGCNDCHTPGYPQSGGKTPEAQWLTGVALGYSGPWGTTYPSNLRIYMQGMTADQWVKAAHSMQARPPMPWFTLRDMNEADLRSIHAFVQSLGAAGEPAPAYLPPGQVPKGPAVVFPGPPPTPR